MKCTQFPLCLKQLQLLWQSVFPLFLLGNRGQIPNLHPEKAKHWSAWAHPQHDSGTWDGMDRGQTHSLDVVRFCVQLVTNSVWKNVWVSAFLSQNISWCSWEGKLRQVTTLVPVLSHLRCCVVCWEVSVNFLCGLFCEFWLFPFPLRAAIWFSGSECTSGKDRNGEQAWNM